MDAVKIEAATFTKWLVGEGPEMAGFVGGAAGDGSFAGKVLELVPGPTTVITATYQFQSSKRPFSALVHVEQTGTDGVVRGIVTDGWGKGRPISGGYTEIRCEHDGITTDCWQGSLTIEGDDEP
jgi:hypothetical protein